MFLANINESKDNEHTMSGSKLESRLEELGLGHVNVLCTFVG